MELFDSKYQQSKITKRTQRSVPRVTKQQTKQDNSMQQGRLENDGNFNQAISSRLRGRTLRASKSIATSAVTSERLKLPRQTMHSMATDVENQSNSELGLNCLEQEIFDSETTQVDYMLMRSPQITTPVIMMLPSLKNRSEQLQTEVIDVIPPELSIEKNGGENQIPITTAKNPHIEEIKGEYEDINKYKNDKTLYQVCRTWLGLPEHKRVWPIAFDNDKIDILKNQPNECHMFVNILNCDNLPTLSNTPEHLEHTVDAIKYSRTLYNCSYDLLINDNKSRWKKVKHHWLKHYKMRNNKYTTSLLSINVVSDNATDLNSDVLESNNIIANIEPNIHIDFNISSNLTESHYDYAL